MLTANERRYYMQNYTQEILFSKVSKLWQVNELCAQLFPQRTD